MWNINSEHVNFKSWTGWVWRSEQTLNYCSSWAEMGHFMVAYPLWGQCQFINLQEISARDYSPELEHLERNRAKTWSSVTSRKTNRCFNRCKNWQMFGSTGGGNDPSSPPRSCVDSVKGWRWICLGEHGIWSQQEKDTWRGQQGQCQRHYICISLFSFP